MRKIETQRYILRIPNVEDAEEIYEKWGTDKEKMAQYKEHKLYRNVIEAKALIAAVIHEKEDGVIFWIIEEKNTKEIVGYIKLLAGVIKDKKREMAFYFLEGWRENGTPEEVLNAVILSGIRLIWVVNLGQKECFLSVISENWSSWARAL